MTYSRPSTSTVNALFRPAMPNQIRDVERQTVRVTGNGRYMDFTDARVAGQNAGQNYKEMSNFLDSVVKTGKPLYDAYIDGKVKQQVAGVLTDPKLVSQLRSGDPVASSTLRSLMPQAQDTVNRALAAASGQAQADIYNVLTTKDSFLNSPKPQGLTDEDWDKQKSQRRAGLRAQAAEQSGISNLPSWAQGEVAPEVIVAQQRADTATFNRSALATDKTLRDNTATGFSGILAGAVSAGDRAIEADQALAKSGQIKPGQAPNTQAFGQGILGRTQSWVAQWENPANGTGFTKEQLVTEILLPGMLSTVNASKAGGTLIGMQQAANTLDLAGVLFAESGVKFADGQSIGNYRMQDGRSIQDFIAQNRQQIQGQIEQLEVKEQMKNVVAPELAKALRDPSYDPALGTQQLLAITKNPELAMSFYGWADRLSKDKLEGTAAQQAEAERLAIQSSKIGADSINVQQQILAASQSGRITLGQTAQLLKANTSGARTDKQNVVTAAGRSEGQIDSSVSAIAGQLKAVRPGFDDRELVSIVKDETIRATIKMTESDISKLRAAGKTVTEEDYDKFYQKNLREYTQSRLRTDALSSNVQGKTFEKQVRAEAEMLQENLYKTRGQVQIGVFPQSVIDGARARGVRMDPASLSKYFVDRLGYITENDDGKTKAFAEPAKIWREMVERGKSGKGPSTSAPRPKGDPTGGYFDSSPLGALLRWTGDRLQDYREMTAPLRPQTSAPKPQASVKPQETSAQPRQSPGPQLLASLLDGVLGIQPASAAGLDTLEGQRRAGNPQVQAPEEQGAGVLNLQNYPAMARIWRQQERVTARTPALPQVDAGRVMGAVPLAINNVAHPFLVAIGINEGTRTWNGGYTRNYYGHRDPGNGAWNVGTVSGQQGGTPGATDRRWAGILTQTAVTVAPILQRMGIPQGTVGFNRLMFNILDLKVQAPAAVPDFIRQLPRVIQSGATIESIAKARANSFINPNTGRLDTTFSSYTRLLQDQRSRAGTFDYKRRT
jgi:hypothetical protein